jgi:hypothetical protein
MASEGFWSATTTEPKRAYRWVLLLGGIPQWMVKKVSKPAFTVSESEHVYLNHKFWYPGRVEWNTVSLTLADPVNPDAAETMMGILDAAGYKLPTSPSEFTTISKAKAVDALGQVTIQQLGSDGSPIETWVLVNAWVKDVKFGELDYTSDDMVDVEIELRYDFAHLNDDKRDNAVKPGGTNSVAGGTFEGTTS